MALTDGSGFGAGGWGLITQSPEPRTPSVVEHGFTFVELLIAATMMSVLFVGLGSHLRAGIAVWQRATQTTETLQRHRVALDRLERDLANAVAYDAREQAYGSEPGKLHPPQFDASELHWFTVEPATREKPSVVRFVTYACREEGGVSGLWRTSQSLGEVRAQRAATPALLLPDCGQFALRYAYLPAEESAPLEWYAQWRPDPKKELPRLVELSVTAAGRQTRRVCFIPTGVLKPFEETPPVP